MKRKTLTSLVLILAVILSLSSCEKEKRVEYCELGIVLDKDFKPYDSGGAFNTAYSDGITIVGIYRLSFVDCEELGLLTTFTPMKFAEAYLDRSGRVIDTDILREGDVPYYCYTDTKSDGESYFYMPTFYRSPYAYFVITFITPDVRKDEGRAEFLEYVSTVYLLQEYL